MESNNKKKTQDRTIAAGQSLQEREYWLEKLSGELTRSTFPFDNIESEKNDYQPGTFKFRFDNRFNTRLMQLRNQSDARLFMVLTAGVLLTLYKYTGNKDLLVGTSIEKQDMEGDFINTVLVLRNLLNSKASFKELLLNVRSTIMDAHQHSNFPLDTLTYELNLPTEDLSALFDVVILLENIHSREYLSHIKNNITFSFSRVEETVEGCLEYNALLYKPETIERIVNHFTSLLEKVMFNLDRPLGEVEMLFPAEKKQLLEDFNGTASSYPSETPLHCLFEEQVEKTPGSRALVFEGKEMAYGELNLKANRLARFLREKGVGPDTVVGLMTDISIEMIVGMMAILKAGGAFLPIEPEYPQERIGYMYRDSNISIILADNAETMATLTADAGNGGIGFTGLAVNLEDEALYSEEHGDGSNLECLCNAENLAYVIYTSGSTGKPKGVMVRHRNIVNQIDGFKKMFYSGDVIFNHILMAPFTFDPSVQHVFSPLTYGAPLFLLPKGLKEDPQRLLAFMKENRIDIFDAVPSQIDMLLELTDDLGGLEFEFILLAGEVFSRNLFTRIYDRFTSRKILNVYGPTEAAINTTMYTCEEEDLHGLLPTIPIGKPLMNYKVLILDKDLNPCPIGVPGELHIGGEGVSRGYINNPQLTMDKFIKNPFADDETLYCSGDFARWLPGGDLEFLGRLDHQVKIRGQRIELEEVELQLMKHPFVKEAVVIAREDKNKIKYLSAYMVADGNLPIADVRVFLAEQLPHYMVPGHFVEVERMPLTPNGKVDRAELLKIERTMKVDAEYVPPGDEIEKKLAEIWQEELEMEQVGIKDDYFNVGGDSIKSIRLLNVINEALESDLKIVDLYENSTIEELAAVIRKKEISDDEKDDYNAAAAELDALKNSLLGGE